MNNQVYFNEEIRDKIKYELSSASKEIIIAVAWFNDAEIYDILLNKAGENIVIEILISNETSNFDGINSLDFQKLIDSGAIVNRLITENVLMHHKFCIIDNHTVITGSYNWTYGAFHNNLENIVVIENDIKLCEKFKTEYYKIIDLHFAHLKEADEILEQMQNMIGDFRQNLKKNRYLPIDVLNKLKKGKSNFLLETNDSNLQYNDTDYEIELISDVQKETWWEQLPQQWKLYLADKELPFGRQEIKPATDALSFLINIEKINCDSYWQKTWSKEQKENIYTFFIKNLDGLSSFSKLKELRCANNNFSDNNIIELNKLSGLKKLDIRLNQIKSIPLNYPLKNLIELDISGNKFQSLDFSSNTPNLEVLICHTNPLTGLQGIEKLSKLRILYIDRNVFDLSFINTKLLNLGFETRDYDSDKIVKLEKV